MAPIKTVALLSATGKLGPSLLSALSAEGFSVTIIQRAGSKAVFPARFNIRTVSDSYEPTELVSAFSGLDAVVLSLPFDLLSQAKKFAEASVAAKNTWFVASTYGPNLEDPRFDVFPASGPHRQIVEDLKSLQKGAQGWSWTNVSCGPWVELSIAANAWNIDPKAKTAELLDNGSNVFSSSTRAQTALAVARTLKRQPDLATNKTIYISSFEVSMADVLSTFKEIVGSEGWKVTSVDSATKLEDAKKSLAEGKFLEGYVGTALCVCTGNGFQNRFSEYFTVANEVLGLPKEDLKSVLEEGMNLENPFA